MKKSARDIYDGWTQFGIKISLFSVYSADGVR